MDGVKKSWNSFIFFYSIKFQFNNNWKLAELATTMKKNKGENFAFDFMGKIFEGIDGILTESHNGLDSFIKSV